MLSAVCTLGVLLVTADPREVCKPEGVRGQIQAVCISPDGKLVAAAAFVTEIQMRQGKTVRTHSSCEVFIWDASSGETRQVIKGLSSGLLFKSLRFSPDGTLLAGADGGKVTVWEVKTGTTKATLLPGGSIAFSANGKVVAVGSNPTTGVNATIQVWNIASAKVIQRIELPKSRAGAVALTAKGDVVASVVLAGAKDYKLTTWDVATGKSAAAITIGANPYLELALSPDGKTAAVVVERTVQVFDLGTGKRTVAHNSGDKDLTALADGVGVVALSGNIEVDRYELDKVRVPTTLLRHDRATLWHFSITPDCKRMVVSSGEANDEREITVYDLRPEK